MSRDMAANFDPEEAGDLGEQWDKLVRCKKQMDDLMREMTLKVSDFKGQDDQIDQIFDDNASLFDENLTSSSTTSERRIDEISADAQQLINEFRNRKPPKIELTNTVRVTPFDIRSENKKRNRIPDVKPMLRKDGQQMRMTDRTDSVIAPSVKVEPLPYTINDIPTFQDVMKELGVPTLVDSENQFQPLYMVDCRMLSEKLLKNLITKRAEIFLKKMEAKKVDRGTQTFVSVTGKQRTAACVNCRSREHRFTECKMPMRPGFCLICGADGFETIDCIYPHGVEHELALNKCVGCSNDLCIYCPECPDCNIRYAGLVDWLRLNYVTLPAWAIPSDHKYLINEHTEEQLRRKIKANFANQNDYVNRVRAFLIRENALSLIEKPANNMTPSKKDLSEEKRRQAVQSLTTEFADQSLDEVMALRPELSDGEEYKVIVPTKYKKNPKN
ncbi:uncharacterized protein LOC127286449 [Leptopilina boulardi]|uniref:uncharacterized protein LOC127280295 n=1 Tax=Leptopilina boulardi TaxID=63433 RepID=UPI0021F5903F|nr:uncharacterized protein LOC127280295 [Leptopilina boulardi]XP_051167362.1 uncharacterized protein LOC127285404 [Leptopilina boulardi]XP_051168837.1 uncharacterized protein LOC127286449 [Leptopilina boulardi]